MSVLDIRDLSEDLPFGARIGGVTLAMLDDQVVRDTLLGMFEDRGMIVFEGVEPSARMQVAISEVFGPLKPHPTNSTPTTAGDLAPGVIDMHSMGRPDDGNRDDLVEVAGNLLARYSPWHFDHCYNDELNRAGVLRSPIIAPEGGRTGFVDGVELYTRISPELRERIETLNVIYTLDTRLSQMRFGKNFKTFTDSAMTMKVVAEARVFPRAMHPAVWTRTTGEKVFHVGPWMAVGIEHHEDAEGETLLEAVCQELNQKAHAYWHDWKPDDMLIWDNWRMLHAVEGCDPRYERRTLRTTIKGDYGLGHFEHGKKIGEVERELSM